MALLMPRDVFLTSSDNRNLLPKAVYDWVGYTRLEWEATFVAFCETTVPNPIVNRSKRTGRIYPFRRDYLVVRFVVCRNAQMFEVK